LLSHVTVSTFEACAAAKLAASRKEEKCDINDNSYVFAQVVVEILRPSNALDGQLDTSSCDAGLKQANCWETG